MMASRYTMGYKNNHVFKQIYQREAICIKCTHLKDTSNAARLEKIICRQHDAGQPSKQARCLHPKKQTSWAKFLRMPWNKHITVLGRVGRVCFVLNMSAKMSKHHIVSFPRNKQHELVLNVDVWCLKQSLNHLLEEQMGCASSLWNAWNNHLKPPLEKKMVCVSSLNEQNKNWFYLLFYFWEQGMFDRILLWETLIIIFLFFLTLFPNWCRRLLLIIWDKWNDAFMHKQMLKQVQIMLWNNGMQVHRWCKV